MIRKEDLIWSPDEGLLTLSGLRFLEVQVPNKDLSLIPGVNCLRFYKMRGLVEQYVDWFISLKELRTEHVLELGLYDGGSLPFWFELLRPSKHVGIDLRARPQSPYLDDYISSPGHQGRIQIYWEVSQDDRAKIPELVDRSFEDGQVDVVFDDASHLYEETKRAFELIFPRVRPGGLYIIEDWAWFHWRGLEREFSGHRPLTDLVRELVELCGSTEQRVIRDIYVCSGFAAVRRGPAEPQELSQGFLERSIYRHSDSSNWTKRPSETANR